MHEMIPEEQHSAPDQNPETACIECGTHASLRCGCCGFPLCHRHHETGGGFCRSFFSVGGVGGCVFDHEIILGVRPVDEIVLSEPGESQYHLPDEEQSTAFACDHADGGVRITLAEAFCRELEFCPDCQDEFRDRFDAHRDEIRQEFASDASDESEVDDAQ